jgi:FkbM family methyltransferase
VAITQRAKNLLAALCYPAIDRLPEPWAVKLKSLGSVLFGDWRSCLYWRNSCPLANALGEVPFPEVERRLAAWDPESQSLIRSYLETYAVPLSALRSLAGLEHVLLLDYARLRQDSRFLPRPLPGRTVGRADADKVASLRRQYRLRHSGAETLIYHHGLTSLPEPQRRYLAGKDIIDAGAYVGDSTLVFMNYAPRRVYAFEPSPRNARAFRQTMRRNHVPEHAFELVPQGLGATPGEACFSDRGGAATFLGAGGTCRVPITTLDQVATTRGLRVGLVKADVEGMGLELLKGALEVIRRDRPVLSLAMYHGPDEFFGQYELLKSLGVGYVLRVVDLTPETPGEITLLAYPDVLA